MDQRLILINLLLKVGVAAAVASILVRSVEFKSLLFRESRSLKQRIYLVLWIGLPLATGVYLLTYKADQYATCNGEKVPVHMNGSSVYILKSGHWQAIYRAQVPLKNQS